MSEIIKILNKFKKQIPIKMPTLKTDDGIPESYVSESDFPAIAERIEALYANQNNGYCNCPTPSIRTSITHCNRCGGRFKTNYSAKG